MEHKDWLNVAISAFLSVLGGLASLLGKKGKKPIKAAELVRNAIVSLSTGAGMFFLLYALLPTARENIFIVFAGGYASGLAGPGLINKIIDRVASENGIKKDDDK